MPMSDLFFHSLCELCISDISEVLLLMLSFDISCCALMLIVKNPAEPARPRPFILTRFQQMPPLPDLFLLKRVFSFLLLSPSSCSLGFSLLLWGLYSIKQ